MNRVLLVTAASLAAIIVPAGAAQAKHRSSPVFVGNPGGSSFSNFGCDIRDRRDGDHHRRIRDCAFIGGNLGYLDYGDYDANRSFDADKWNDWWHERPSRSYPRWVQEKHDCNPERMWWSGSGLHC